MKMIAAAVVALLFCGLSASRASADPIQFVDQLLAVHGNGSLLLMEGVGSNTYFSTLDNDNLGSFGWTFKNTTGLTLSDVSVLAFLDAEIDSAINTFFNEFGAFVSLTLPGAAPSGAGGASTWEIDEPGFVFGDIFANFEANTLDNTNGVPSGTPDDVSLALGFSLGDIAPGDVVRLVLLTSMVDIGGLQHHDPDSDVTFYFNGYATIQPGTSVPEPAMLALIALGIGGLWRRRLRPSVDAKHGSGCDEA
jgi:hypothetical protein